MGTQLTCLTESVLSQLINTRTVLPLGINGKSKGITQRLEKEKISVLASCGFTFGVRTHVLEKIRCVQHWNMRNLYDLYDHTTLVLLRDFLNEYIRNADFRRWKIHEHFIWGHTLRSVQGMEVDGPIQSAPGSVEFHAFIKVIRSTKM